MAMAKEGVSKGRYHLGQTCQFQGRENYYYYYYYYYYYLLLTSLLSRPIHHPGMAQDLMDSNPLHWVHFQHPPNQIPALLAQMNVPGPGLLAQ